MPDTPKPIPPAPRKRVVFDPFADQPDTYEVRRQLSEERQHAAWTGETHKSVARMMRENPHVGA